MTMSFFATAVIGVALFTNLFVEAFKKLLDEKGKPYSANIMAVIISVILALMISIFYFVLYNVPFSATYVVQTIVLMILSFLTSTVGYDKVIQTIIQIKNYKNGG